MLTEAADRYDRDPEEAARASQTLLVQARAIPPSKGARTTTAVSLEADLAEALKRVDPTGPDRLAPGPPLGLLRLLLDPSVQERSPEAMRSGASLLEALARTSVRDPLGGGFHRGFHDREATCPRFEQLLCHNALLLRAYARTAGLLRNLFLRDVAREIVGWSLREMRDASGVFWSGRSAVGRGEEGAFYVWTREEIVRWLEPDRASEWLGVYRLQPPGLFVLQGSPFAGLGSSREVLLGRRARRVPPPVDDEVLTGWNGLMIGALAVSGQSLNRGSDLEAARRAATVLLDRAGPGKARRGFPGSGGRSPALLEDYAYLAEGLLDLAEATGEARWRTDATALVDAAVLRFWDTSWGTVRDGRARYALRPKRGRDSELPRPTR